MGKISIILAVLDYDENCKISINSIFNLKVLNSNLFKELIIILGDISKKQILLNDYKDKMQGSTLIKIEESKKGIYAAYNTGLKRAEGEYLIFIGGGEEINYDEDIYRKLKQVIDLGLDAYLFNLSIDNNKSIERLDPKYIKCPPHQSIIYKNKLIKSLNLKYDESLRIYADGIFTNFYMKQVESFIFLPFALVDFKKGGLGNSIKGLRFRILDRLKILFVYRKNLKGLLAFIKYLLNETIYCFKLFIKK